MSSAGERRDLMVLVADRNTKAAVSGILNRPRALRIRQVKFQVLIHPQNDPGVLQHAHTFLRPFVGKYQRAIVVFDREGCGKETTSGTELEAEVESRLAKNGWADRARAVVIEPELESWVWSDSPQVDNSLGWAGRTPALRPWLVEKGFVTQSERKPERPKEAVEAALHFVGKPRSSSVYRELAERVSLRRCTDPAFQKLIATLQAWFPPEEHPETQNEDSR